MHNWMTFPPATLTRQTKWRVENETRLVLKLSASTLHQGVWTFRPESVIRPGQTVTFTARSSAPFGGVRGKVSYESDAGEFTFCFENPGLFGSINGTVDYAIDAGEFTFTWKNPAFRSPDFQVGEPAGYEVLTDDRSEIDQVLTSRIVKLSDDD
ncbi:MULTISPECIES: hypothetical protein [unclassified Bradyrhizobium]|uniref:hypothetical protein n=1 Tax=unclassified Bradyrhizobium TaxID=2631580 RepID=UPI0011614FF0|nr:MULTISPECIES: hypothetical protein [unclassified Bradyrhizobium]